MKAHYELLPPYLRRHDGRNLRRVYLRTEQQLWRQRETNPLTRRQFLAALSAGAALAIPGRAGASQDAENFPDIHSVQPDLVVPPVSTLPPGPGRRVVRTLPGYEHTDVHHLLYLPVDWQPGKVYPMLVDYPGNGNYHSPYGDVSTGEVEGCNLGYGISGGQGFIWIAMPFVDPQHKSNQRMWWGDVDATLDYCKHAVVDVCEQFGGDNASVILCGFSRGAIACNFIGLHNKEVADIWLAFIPFSHYDGVEKWDWAGSDRASALDRLELLNGRASFISQEKSIDNIRDYLKSTPVEAPFTFQTIPYRNHNSGWTLCDIPARRALRAWLGETLAKRPGVYDLRGKVRDAHGGPVKRVRIQSGYTHWAFTDGSGDFLLRGLVASQRIVMPIKEGADFRPPQLSVEVGKKAVKHLDFRLL